MNCLVYDERGDFPGIRYLSVSKLARVSGFDDEDTVTFLKQCAPRNDHRYLGNAVTGGTYYHVYDAVQKSLRPDPDFAAFSNYMTDILALVAEPSFPKPETLPPTPLPPPDYTSAYSPFPAPPVTVLDDLIAAIEDTTVPPSITRPGSKPKSILL